MTAAVCKRVAVTAIVAASVCGPGPLLAQEGADPSAQELQEKAERIEQLLAGKLDPSIDPSSALVIELAARDGVSEYGASNELIALLEAFEKPRSSQRTSSIPATDVRTAAEHKLLTARVAFFSLPAKKRAELLRRHQEKQGAVPPPDQAAQDQPTPLVQTRAMVDELEEFLSGSADPGSIPPSALRVNLLDDPGLVTDKTRRRAFLEQALQSRGSSDPSGKESEAVAFKRALERLDELRARFLARSGEEQNALDTARAGATALGDLQRKETETERAIAEEHARLLAIKEQQALFEAGLNERRAALLDTTVQALRWSRRVRELASAPKPTAKEADRAYDELVDELVAVRRSLRQSLEALFTEESAAGWLDVGAGSALPEGLNDELMRDLVVELEDSGRRLQTLEHEIKWETMKVERDAMVSMNRNRLELMHMVTPAKRAALRGFDSVGLQQVRRELEQITLGGRYHLLSLPRFFRAQRAALESSPLLVVRTIVEILLLIVLFRWWRKSADDVLDRFRRTWRFRRPQTGLSRAISTGLWYLKRIRRPLEWLVLLFLLDQILSTLSDLPELDFVWIVLRWILFGSLIIQLVNAIAQRQGGYGDTPNLRFRSLRMVGMTIVVVGLVLTLTDASVGQGSIYAWVRQSSGLLILPIFVMLVVWWRPTIFERAKAESESVGILKWVSRHDKGMTSFASATVGGIALLLDGLRRFALAQASQVGFTRKLVSYFFRRQVEQQTSIDPEATQHAAISPELYERLGPNARTDVCVESIAQDDVSRVRKLLRAQNNVVVCVAGLRGIGKTTFIDRVAIGLTEEACWRIECGRGNFDSLVRQLAVAGGLAPDASYEELVARLAERKPTLVCIDDAQRLIRPVIGGLRDIDRFVTLAHDSSPTTSWLLSVGLPAWQYLGLAKGERVLFDQVVELEGWDEADIAKLIRQRTEDASITPSFKGLDIPRQVDIDARVSEEERNRRDFYRILWDHSDGNPGFALHLWRESLYQGMGADDIRVRLFKVPSANDLDEVPSAAHFVLRAIMQVDVATEDDVVQITGLSAEVVADALRMGRARGYIERDDEGLRIALAWYSAVFKLLRKHHLLTI